MVVLATMETRTRKTLGHSLAEATGKIEVHTIHYRRPDAFHSLVKMTTLNEQEAEAQVKRLRALGYTVVDVKPPIAG
jgi:hypothetical protein